MARPLIRRRPASFPTSLVGDVATLDVSMLPALLESVVCVCVCVCQIAASAAQFVQVDGVCVLIHVGVAQASTRMQQELQRVSTAREVRWICRPRFSRTRRG
jgi:hypothetical protein